MSETNKEKEKNEKVKKPKKERVKVVYDVDGINKKQRKGVNIGKKNVAALVGLVLVEAVFYYFVTPSINLQSPGFWIWVIFTLGALTVCTLKLEPYRRKESEKGVEIELNRPITKASKTFFWSGIVLFGLWIILAIASSPVFNAGKYASLLKVQDGNFDTDIVNSEDVNDIALMDTDSARIIGDRAIGSLSDVVSQYEVSDDYSTIDYNGRPMKVAPLEYAGFFKYMNNRKDGIPGYVLVDPVKNEAQYVKLAKSIKYSPSAYFNNNLERHVQLSYPTKIFNGYYFELDNEGNPYYICPTLEANAGLFGAKDVSGVVICDPCTGDTKYYDVAAVPNWVDRVYDGDLACQKYDWYGNLSGGYLNSIVGNKGCKVTTDDYGYKVMDDDVWVYTGVTSVNGDESNIGFVLINLRTSESKYFSIAGAEEYSAMSSAEGQVQHLGYEASFPSLINIQGVPTYIMVLKDNAGLVKMYAMVNVEKYNIVATANTQRDTLNAYKKLLVENGIVGAVDAASSDIPNKKITIAGLKYITMDGETYVYITDKNGDVYKQNFADNEELIFLQEGDTVTLYYVESENGIHELIAYEY